MERILVKMISKITCLVFLLRLINKDIFFYFTIIISKAKAILKTGTTSCIASVVSRFYQFFIYLGLDVQHRFPYRSTNLENLNSRMKRYLTVSSTSIDICFVSGKEISSFCPDISARETPRMEGERFEIYEDRE